VGKKRRPAPGIKDAVSHEPIGLTLKYRPSHIAEYVALVLSAGLIRLLPLRAALALGWCFAAGTHFLGRLHVERTRGRIRQVFGDRLTEKQVRQTAWLAWRNLCFNAVEGLRFAGLTPKKVRRQPIAQLETRLKEIRAESEAGFILATPHMGNWEMAGITADLLGIPLFVIVRKQKNPLIDAYINRMRRSFRMEVLYRESKVWKQVVDRIKRGMVLAVLPDIGVRAKGMTVEFLNGHACIATGTARFAQMANCPVYPVVVRRIGWTRHDAVLLDPVAPDADADATEDEQRMMQEIMAVISREILRTPEQYFWHNKRWVLNRPATP
jgi:KDO2-lipid IV(A) lauroyltransferase